MFTDIIVHACDYDMYYALNIFVVTLFIVVIAPTQMLMNNALNLRTTTVQFIISCFPV